MRRALIFCLTLVLVGGLLAVFLPDAQAAKPTHLLCELPGKGTVIFAVEKHGTVANTVQACLAKGGHPAGVFDKTRQEKAPGAGR